MAAPLTGNTGRLAEVLAQVYAGARMPVTKEFNFHTLAASTTYTFKREAGEAFTLRHVSAYVNALGGAATLTVDIQKNGVSCLTAVISLAADTAQQREGFGTDQAGNERHFLTDTEANRAKLRFEKDDLLSVIIVVGAGGAPVGFDLALTCDERQQA
jgi:hypothetical protein